MRLILGLTLCLWASPARAEDAGDTRRLIIPTGPSLYLGLEGSGGYGSGRQALALWGIYEARPLIFYRDGRKTADIIAGRTLTDLSWGYGLHDRLSVGARLPILAQQEGRTISGRRPLAGFALLDPAFGAKLTLLPKARGLGLALSGRFTIPVDDGQSYASEAGFSLGGALAAELPIGPRIDALINLSYLSRGAQSIDHIQLSDALGWGLGLSWRPALDWTLVGELRGDARAAAPFEATEEAPIDGDLAARLRIWRDLSLVVSGGAGLTPGYGAPAWRGLLGIEWGPQRHDFDGDGVEDDADQCPKVPGAVVHRGCPAPASGPTDQDRDGIPDAADRCPTLPEDKDGFLDADGCPDPDQDLDLIADEVDRAPTAPEDWDGVEDEDGAPDLDPAPTSRPTRRGQLKLSGRWARAEGPDAPLLLGETLHPPRPLRFERGGARLSPEARGLVDGFAAFLKLNPAITWVEIGVHTDLRDKPRGAYLSSRRAHAIRERIIHQGVAPARLKAQGYGARIPLTQDASVEGRAKNRRVELRILKGAPRGHWSAEGEDAAAPREDWHAPDAVVLRPREPISFEPGTATLKAQAVARIEALVNRIEARPEYPALEIGVHTDGRGDAAQQRRLSEARAEVIRQRMIAQGVEARRLLIKGYGNARRLRSPATPAGRARNERVELWVRPKRFIREVTP